MDYIIDYLFMGFIVLVVLGGVVCLLVFLPKEHDYEDKYSGCYRIMYRDGVYSITHKKPGYGENVYSIRSKYFYIKNSPFKSEAFCDEAETKSGKKYRANGLVTVYFPEDKLQVFAPTFHGVSQDIIEETVEETVSAALTEALPDYDETAGTEAFKEIFKEKAAEKLAIFGLIIMSVNELKITESK